jgi:hypothetical protein
VMAKGLIVAGLAVAGIGAAAAKQLPEIRRYLKIESM